MSKSVVRQFLILTLTGILFSVVAPAQPNQPSPAPDRVILNLTENPSTSVAVTWRTDTTVTGAFVEWQQAMPMVDINTVSSFPAKTLTRKSVWGEEPEIVSNHHSGIIQGLQPGERYVYRVGVPGNWSEWFQFEMPAEKANQFSFIYFGDPQSDLKSQWSRVIRAAYSHDPSAAFMVYGGDLINRAGRDWEWHEWFEAGSFIYGMIPQVMTPGNHDYDGLTLDPHWNAQLTLPHNGPRGLEGTCYIIDYKNLRLISIDSAADSELRVEDGFKLKAQKTWLDSVLRTNNHDWVIVTTHLPFYSPKENRDNVHLRQHFQPILEKYKVDMVLSGHDHSYGRGRTTDNPGNGHEVMYVVSVSGPKMYEAGDKDWMEQSGSFKQLYQRITIDGKELRYQAYTVDGKLFDEFKLNKNE
jgi:acid phosphatase type 7